MVDRRLLAPYLLPRLIDPAATALEMARCLLIEAWCDCTGRPGEDERIGPSFAGEELGHPREV